MKPSVLALATWLLACPVSAQITAQADDMDWLGEDFAISVQTRVGFVGTPYPAPEASVARGRAASTVIASHYRFHPQLRLGTRIPLLDTDVRLPGNSLVIERVFGNPEVHGDLRLLSASDLELSLRLAVGIPLGGGTAEPERPLHQNQAFALVHAVHGFLDPELHSPGRLPVTPSVRLRHVNGALVAGAFLKLPIGIQVTESTSTPARAIHPISFGVVVGGHLAYYPWDWLFLSFRAWFSAEPVAAAELTSGHSGRFQPVVEPQIGVLIKDTIQISTTALLPVGGPLSDEVLGVGLHVGLVP